MESDYLTDAELAEAERQLASGLDLEPYDRLVSTLLPRVLKEVRERREDNERYLRSFSHYHAAKYIDERLVDTCNTCGLDLRDPIHRRIDAAGERK